VTPVLSHGLPIRRTLPWLAGAVLTAAYVLLFLALPPVVAVALPLVVGAGLALLRWPWLGVVMLVASVPAQQLGAVGGLTLTRLSLVAAIVGLLILWTLGTRQLHGTRLAIPFLALIVWMFLTAAVARDIGLALADLFRWTVAFVAFLAIIQILSWKESRIVTVLILAIAVAGAFEAGFGTALGLLGLGPESFKIEGAFSRAFGTFGRPNTFAGYLEMSLFPVLWFGLFRLWHLGGVLRLYRDSRRRGFAVSATQRRSLVRAAVITAILLGSSAIMFGGIVVSFSRGAWIGVLAGLAVTMFVAARRYWHLIVPAVPGVALLAILAVQMLAPEALADRASSIADEARPFDASSIPITPDNFAVVERMAHWQAGWRMFEDHPVTGVGSGNFNANYPDYYVRETFQFSQGHAHNFYIHVLAENGMVGLALYLTLILSFAFLALYVALATDNRLTGALALGALGTMAAVYVHNGFENLHVLNLSIQISVSWALAVVAWQRLRDERSTSELSSMEYSAK